jgi:CRISPR/Cas system-associated protein Cas7 (RAMP superfamily)
MSKQYIQVQTRMDRTRALLLRDWAIDRRKEVSGFRLNHWLSETLTDGMRKEGII